MTTDVDIVNLAISEIGKGPLITALDQSSPAAIQASLQYNPMRQQLLRAAPWGFARKTIVMDQIGLLVDGTAPYPWQAKYTYPEDCLKMRYVLPPPFPTTDVDPDVSSTVLAPWCMPSRSFRYIVAYDETEGDNDTIVTSKVVLSNLIGAYGVYTADVEDPGLFDPLFQNALVMALANKFVMPLTGNVGLKQGYAKLANEAVMEARATDGNESIPSTDHSVDWMVARNSGYNYTNTSGVGPGGVNWGNYGEWYSGYDNWSM